MTSIKSHDHRTKTALPPFHARERDPKGTNGRRREEYPEPRKSITGLYPRYRMAQPLRISQRKGAGRGLPHPQMEKRTELQTQKRTLGLHRQPDCSPLRIRISG